MCVVDEAQYNLNFGALKVGQTCTHNVKIVNDTTCTATISLAVSLVEINYLIDNTEFCNPLAKVRHFALSRYTTAETKANLNA